MSKEALKIISDAMSEMELNYDFMEWTSTPAYPYFTGEYQEIEPLYEDGMQETSFILNGFARDVGEEKSAYLELEDAKEKIEACFGKVGGKTVTTDIGTVVAIFYAGGFPVATGDASYYLMSYVSDLKIWKNKTTVSSNYVDGVFVSKNLDAIMIYLRNHSSSYQNHLILKSNDGISFKYDYLLSIDSSSDFLSFNIANTFECKDILYCMGLVSNINYQLLKMLNLNENMIMSTEIAYGFVDGVYFDGSQLFINNHEMLIVKNGESIADKTIDDLIEIAPELTMNCITKAFGQIYIFGNQGAILKSSVETNNEESIAIQTLSAKKALAEANKYTDEQYAALEVRIITLEEKIAALETALETE